MIPQPALQTCRAALLGIGYKDELIRLDYHFADFDRANNSFARSVSLAAFSEYPPNYRNSCLAFIDSNSARSGAKWAFENRALGAPLVFEIVKDKVQPWSIGFEEARPMGAAFALSDIGKVIRSKGEIWKPDVLSRVKSEISPDPQLDLFDNNLLAMLEEFFQPKLKDVLERAFAEIQNCFEEVHGQKANVEQLFNYLFRFVTAKIFQDRGDVKGWENLADPFAILQKAIDHSDSEMGNQLPAEFLHPQLLATAWNSVSTTLNFQNFFVPEVAFIYEEAFINTKTRKELGIHSTPEKLVDYIVENLPWEQVDVEQRRVFEPFCGHGIFLARSLERLKRDIVDITPQERHDYFRRMLVGVEKDALALEVCRLMLTLSDYPNNNSWNLNRADVFDWPKWDETLASAGAVLANPPYEKFRSDSEERALNPEERAALNLRKAEAPAEMLFRLMRQPPPLLGLVLPYSFLNGPSYREANRQIAERYETVSLVELPRIFRYARNQTVALMASGRREKNTSVSVSFAEVHKGKLQDFWDKGTVSNERTATLEIRGGAFSLRVAPEDSIVQYLPAYLPRLSSIAEVHQGVHWISRDKSVDKEKAMPRTDVASDVSQDGFMLGVEKMKGNLSQFQISNRRYLSLLPEHQDPSTKANERDWGLPKVVCNHARFQQDSPWRLSAWSDEEGLAFTQQFFAIWPNHGVSIFAIVAVLCSPVANAFVWEIDRGRDNRISTLNQLPLPSKEKLVTDGSLHRQAQALQQLLASATPSEAQITESLMRLDAAVLDAYELSASAQRFLLDKFQVFKRPVSVPFAGYFPDDFTEEIKLSDYIALTHGWDAKNERRIELIHKNVAHTISRSEKLELENLQELANERIRQLAPLPLRELEEFKRELRRSGIVIPE